MMTMRYQYEMMYQYEKCVLLRQLGSSVWDSVVGDIGKSALWLSLRPPGRTFFHAVCSWAFQSWCLARCSSLLQRNYSVLENQPWWSHGFFFLQLWRFFFWYPPLKHQIFRRDKASSSLMPKSCRLVWDVVVWKRGTPLHGQWVGNIMIPQRIFRQAQIGFGWKRQEKTWNAMVDPHVHIIKLPLKETLQSSISPNMLKILHDIGWLFLLMFNFGLFSSISKHRCQIHRGTWGHSAWFSTIPSTTPPDSRSWFGTSRCCSVR